MSIELENEFVLDILKRLLEYVIYLIEGNFEYISNERFYAYKKKLKEQFLTIIHNGIEQLLLSSLNPEIQMNSIYSSIKEFLESKLEGYYLSELRTLYVELGGKYENSPVKEIPKGQILLKDVPIRRFEPEPEIFSPLISSKITLTIDEEPTLNAGHIPYINRQMPTLKETVLDEGSHRLPPASSFQRGRHYSGLPSIEKPTYSLIDFDLISDNFNIDIYSLKSAIRAQKSLGASIHHLSKENSFEDTQEMKQHLIVRKVVEFLQKLSVSKSDNIVSGIYGEVCLIY